MMPAPSLPARSTGTPTGEARFRRNWRGRLVLQCEFRIYNGDSAMGEQPRVWRDAPEWSLRHIRHYRKTRGLEPLI